MKLMIFKRGLILALLVVLSNLFAVDGHSRSRLQSIVSACRVGLSLPDETHAQIVQRIEQQVKIISFTEFTRYDREGYFPEDPAWISSLASLELYLLAGLKFEKALELSGLESAPDLDKVLKLVDREVFMDVSTLEKLERETDIGFRFSDRPKTRLYMLIATFLGESFDSPLKRKLLLEQAQFSKAIVDFLLGNSIAEAIEGPFSFEKAAKELANPYGSGVVIFKPSDPAELNWLRSDLESLFHKQLRQGGLSSPERERVESLIAAENISNGWVQQENDRVFQLWAGTPDFRQLAEPTGDYLLAKAKSLNNDLQSLLPLNDHDRTIEALSLMPFRSDDVHNDYQARTLLYFPDDSGTFLHAPLRGIVIGQVPKGYAMSFPGNNNKRFFSVSHRGAPTEKARLGFVIRYKSKFGSPH